jgi:hypothetical protein
MTQPRNLIPGNCYFHCSYYDRNLLFPYIQTLRFVESHADENGEINWLFEEPIESDEEAPEPPTFISFSDDQLDSVLELGDLQIKLKELSCFHPLTPRPIESARYKSRIELIQRFELSGKVSELLASETENSLSIGIRYTDDACLLQKKGGELQLKFFQHPLMDSESEAALFQLFAARGIGPSTNYLADNGRTRVLDFSVPPKAEVLADIVAEACISVFRITLDDELVFSRGAI